MRRQQLSGWLIYQHRTHQMGGDSDGRVFYETRGGPGLVHRLSASGEPISDRDEAFNW